MLKAIAGNLSRLSIGFTNIPYLSDTKRSAFPQQLLARTVGSNFQKLQSMKITDSNLGQLMSGLIYPAFLGASIVYFIQHNIVEINSSNVGFTIFNIKNGFALWLLIYYCLVYISMTKYELKKRYDFIHFVLDFVESLTILFGLYTLGFVTNNFVNPRLFYLVASLIPLLGLLKNLYTKGKIHKLLIGVSISICVIMFSLNFNSESICHVVALFALYVLLIWYSIVFVKNKVKV